MNKKFVVRALALVILVFLTGTNLLSQSDRDVKTKQVELKKEYNEAQEKNQIIRAAAVDKPRASTGRRRSNVTTGYDYTQVKGYGLRTYYERIDKLFERANDLGLFEEQYRKDGTFPVPGRKGLGNSQMRRVEVYYVEATPEEQEKYDIDPFELIELRVEKLETLPPEEVGTETEESGLGLGFASGGGEPVPKSFTLSGADLLMILKLVDESLYSDILTRRNQEAPIPLPADLFLPDKRGPFIIQTDRELETTTNRFIDFWNPRDTLRMAILPPTFEAAGPFMTSQVPVFYPEESKIRIRNPEKEKLKITEIAFVGDNSSDFVVRTKLPLLLDEKGGTNDKADIQFEYVGNSQYEVKSQLFIQAKESNMSQGIDIIANPGKTPADFIIIDASLDKIELRSPVRSSFAANWKVSYAAGNEEIGLPRWTSGISSIGLGYKNEMRVGVVLPMNLSAPDLPDPLAFHHTLLSSPMGYKADFDFTFGFPFSLGGNLTVIEDFDGQKAYEHLKVIKNYQAAQGKTDYNNDFFHISSIIQLYYPIMFKDRMENPNFNFLLNIGGAYMKVHRDHLVIPGDPGKEGMSFTDKDIGKMFTLGKEKDIVDVYVRLSLINVSAKNNYGFGLQYFAGRMMADAWLEFTRWFRVEAKYSFLLRDKELWETDHSYFMITPRLRIGLPSIFN